MHALTVNEVSDVTGGFSASDVLGGIGGAAGAGYGVVAGAEEGAIMGLGGGPIGMLAGAIIGGALGFGIGYLTGRVLVR